MPKIPSLIGHLASVDVKQHEIKPMPKHGSIFLYVHGNQKARQDGQPRTAISTLTQLLNYVLGCFTVVLVPEPFGGR